MADLAEVVAVFQSQREWPGIDPGHDHGEPYENDSTDNPLRYCWSCGGAHGITNTSCDGLRAAERQRCPMTLGEVTCFRPLGHFGEHHADSGLMDIRWTVKQ